MGWLKNLLADKVADEGLGNTALVVREERQVTNQISTELAREDVPKFKRTYKVKLDHRAMMEIEARTWRLFGSERRWSGMLHQPNGSYVFFDPHRVADKILDPTLVPLINSHCAEIFRMDQKFLSSGTGEFMDESGHRWKLIE